jgi:hypothetical protein
MFIKKVYQYHKKLAIGMLFFAFMQLVCFYKAGMHVSPWYNYGMYSQPVYIQPAYRVYKVGNLNAQYYSAQAWDQVHYTLQQYMALPQNDSLYEHEIKRIFAKAHLPIPNKSKYIFDASLVKKKGSVLGNKFNNIDSSIYKWNGEKLIKDAAIPAP